MILLNSFRRSLSFMALTFWPSLIAAGAAGICFAGERCECEPGTAVATRTDVNLELRDQTGTATDAEHEEGVRPDCQPPPKNKRAKQLSVIPLPKPIRPPLVLEFGVNALKQEIVVTEGQDFWVVTGVGQTRWTVAGKVGRIVDGIVTVDLVFQSRDTTEGKASSQLKLKVDEYLGGGYGGLTIMIHRPWIRRGLDPVPVLVEALTKRDAGFYAAARYLAKLGPAAKAAVPELVKVLKSDNESLYGEPYNTAHQIAAETLGMIGPEARLAVPVLAEVLKDQNGHVRVAAGLALWRIGRHPTAIPALIEALKHENKSTRFVAIQAFEVIGVEAPTAASALSEVLDDRVPTLRVEAAVVLWHISRDEDAIDALLDALKHEDEMVRASAAGAFGRIGPGARRAIPALVHSILNDVPRVQKWSAVSLTKIDPTAILTVPEFSKVTKSEEQRLRAGKALKHFGRCAIPRLSQALTGEDENVRLMVIDALYSFGSAAVDLWIALLSHEDEDVRLTGALTLNGLGAEAKAAIPSLAKALQDKSEPVRTASAAALVELGSQAIPTVTEALDAENPLARALAAEILGQIGSDAEGAVPKLTERLRDSNEDVRNAAAAALKQIGSMK